MNTNEPEPGPSQLDCYLYSSTVELCEGDSTTVRASFLALDDGRQRPCTVESEPLKGALRRAVTDIDGRSEDKRR